MITPQLRPRTRPESLKATILWRRCLQLKEGRQGNPRLSLSGEQHREILIQMTRFGPGGPALIAILPSIGFLVTGEDFVRDFLLFCLMLAFMFALIKSASLLFYNVLFQSLNINTLVSG